MALPDEYRVLADDVFPSVMLAVYAEETAKPEREAVEARLREAGFDLADVEPIESLEQPDVEWAFSAMVRFAGRAEPMEYRLALVPSFGTEMLDINDLLTPEEMEATRASRWSVSVATQFGPQPLEDFHHQLQLIAPLTEGAVSVADALPQEHLPAGWVRDAAASQTPPSPRSLFRVQAIVPEGQPAHCWLHSHGLLRCGRMEVEALEVPEDAAWPVQELLYAVGMWSLEHPLPEPGEAFEPMAGARVVWLPWQEALQHVDRRATGASPEEREDVHGAPGAVLFTPPAGLLRKRYGSPAKYARLLTDNPVVAVSEAETDRMSRLARERFPRFAALQERFGSREDWLFAVKIGLPTDRPVESGGLEHLFFQVHAIKGDRVDATAMNDAYFIASVREGKRGEFPLEGMSDWTILCEHGQFSPDTVFHLERLVRSTP